MAVKFLQSLVQRGAPVVGARVTGRECNDFGQTMPAILSSMQRPDEYRLDPETASAVHGAGRSLGKAGAASAKVAINAIRAVPSGWPVSSVSVRNVSPSTLTPWAPRALRRGWRGPVAG